MCKVFMVTNMAKVENLNQAINVISAAVSETETDGFGYVIQGSNGIYGERTLETEKFKTMFKKPIMNDVFVETGFYNRFGTKTKPTGCGLFHGRTSTNDVNLVNTHPLNKYGWSLIHNGVVSNHGPKYTQTTTNDTEHILHWLANGGISNIEKYITGYYAVGAINPLGQLVIFKDDTASLYSAKLPELDAYVFATTYELIEEVCAELKWKTSVIAKVIDNTYLVFEKEKLVEHKKITPRGRTSYEDAWAQESLGHTLSSSHIQGVSESYYPQPAEDKEIAASLVGPEDRAKFMAHVSDQLSKYEEMSMSEQQFLYEVIQMADASYVYKSYYGEEMTREEFLQQSEDEMLYCTVIRPDGTLVDQVDYERETLYEGPHKARRA